MKQSKKTVYYSCNHRQWLKYIIICYSFCTLGLLMKRSTCLYATKDRLKLIQQFLQKVGKNWSVWCNIIQTDSKKPSKNL